jgi:hypothetical protein
LFKHSGVQARLRAVTHFGVQARPPHQVRGPRNDYFLKSFTINGACSAWNIAVLPEHLREEALRRNIEEYKRINPGIDDADDHANNLRKLIQKKLQMFPGVKKVIIDALIEPISDTKYRIVVVSSDNPEQFGEMLTKASILRK